MCIKIMLGLKQLENGYKIQDGNLYEYRRNIFDEIYNVYSVKKYSRIKVDKINEIYDIKKYDYYYHDFISNLLKLYVCNDFHMCIFKKLDVDKSILNNIGDYKNNAAGLKKLLKSRLTYANENNDIALRTSIKFIEILTIKKKTAEIYKKILRETYVGLYFINELKKYIPNLAYTYCYVECAGATIENNKITNWCNQAKNDLIPYLIKETLPEENPKNLFDCIMDNEIKSIENIIKQFENILNLMNILFSPVKVINIDLKKFLITNSRVKIPFYVNNINPSEKFDCEQILFVKDFSIFHIGNEVTEKDKGYTPKDFSDIIRLKLDFGDIEEKFESGDFLSKNFSDLNKLKNTDIHYLSNKSVEIDLNDMEKRQRADDELYERLIKEGHTCIRRLETYPTQTLWCHRSPCKNNLKDFSNKSVKTDLNDMEKRQKADDELYERLIKEGHTCMRRLETYPTQTLWCHQSPCKGRL